MNIDSHRSICYDTAMTDQTTTPVRVRRETRRLFRMIAARTDERLQDMLHRLAEKELARLDANESPPRVNEAGAPPAEDRRRD